MVEEKHWPDHYHPYKSASCQTFLYRILMTSAFCYVLYWHHNYFTGHPFPRLYYLTSINFYQSGFTSALGILQYLVPNKKTSCITTIYGYSYVASFSYSLFICIFYWTFQEHKYNLYSIYAHAVLALVLYIPHLYEFAPVRCCHLVFNAFYGVAYICLNYIYSTYYLEKPVYDVITYKNYMTIVYIAGAFLQMIVGYSIGYMLFRCNLSSFEKDFARSNVSELSKINPFEELESQRISLIGADNTIRI